MGDPTTATRLGRAVRGRREAAGWTQRRLADEAGVSIRLVQNVEQGVCTRPRAASLRRLADALGISPTEQAALTRLHGQPAAVMGAAPLRVELLGPLRVTCEGRPVDMPGGRCRAVLALIALQAGQVTSLGTLTAALWDGQPPPTAQAMVQALVGRVRSAVGQVASRPSSTMVETIAGGYRLCLAHTSLDIIDFRRHAQRALHACRAGDVPGAGEAAEAGLALWRDEPLSDIALLRGHPAVAALSAEHTSLVLAQAKAAFQQGRHDEVVPALFALAERHPLDEPVYAALMTALAGTGRQAAALEVFDQVRRRLHEQLGVLPGAVLAEAHVRVLRQEVVVTTAAQPGTAVPPIPATVGNGHQPAASAPHPDPVGAALGLPCQLPPAAADFTGRTAEVARLREWLAAPAGKGTVPVVVISGLPGAGKSTLAVQAAQLLRAEFPDGQLWAPLDGSSSRPRDPGEVLDEWLRALGVPGSSIPAAAAERSALFRTRLADRRVLAVLDDAVSAAQVTPLLPGTSGCAVLVTSRRQLPEVAGALFLPLEPMDHDEAHDLLARVAGAGRVAAEPQAAANLVAACGRLPLAVRIAGAKLAARPSMPLAGLAHDLAQEQGWLAGLSGRPPPDAPRLSVLHVGDLSVRASIASGYQALNPPAQRAFCLLGMLGPCDVAEWVIAALLGCPADGVAEELTDRSMLTVAGTDETGQPRYRLHDLLRDYATEQATRLGSEERCAALTRALDSWLQLATMADSQLPSWPFLPKHHRSPSHGVVPLPEAERLTAQPLAWFHAERENLLTITEQCAALGRHRFAAELAHCQADVQRLEDRHHDSARMWRAVASAAAAAGDEVVLARTRLPLALAMMSTGAVEDAVGMLHQCASAFERHGDDDGLAFALNWLGETQWMLERLEEARSAAERGAAVAQRAGNRHAEFANLMTLGMVLASHGDHEAGMVACERAAAVAAESSEPAHQETALHYLALACVLAGQYERALALCEARRDICTGMGDAAGVALAWAVTGDACYGLARYADALAAYHQALPTFRDRSLPRYHALCLYKLGCVHHGLHAYPQATRYLAESLAMFRELGLDGYASRAEDGVRACREPSAGPPVLPINASERAS